MQNLQTAKAPPFPFSHSLSSANAISPLSLLPQLSSLSITLRRPPPSTLIHMGGGPRTYPGGVSKWQWKRMQANKSKQLLKARLSRERQIYEMRKRAELKAAVSDLERPWEIVQRGVPKSTSLLFSVSADEQLKVLADRFQKPGGFDMWSDNDGPQLFHTPEGSPSARFFPKGVVHSIKPYSQVDDGMSTELKHMGSGPNQRSTFKNSHSKEDAGLSSLRIDGKQGKNLNGGYENDRNWMDLQKARGSSKGRRTSYNARVDRSKLYGKGRNSGRLTQLHDEDVYDMRLQGDGSYSFIGRKDDKLRS